MAAPIRQPRTPSPAPQLGEDTYTSAFTGGFNNNHNTTTTTTSNKPPHLGRQSLGPPPTVRSNSGGPLSPGSGLYQHSQSNHQHFQQQQQQQQRVSLADPRASSPRLPGAGYGGNGNGLSAAGLGAGLRNVSAGSAFGASQYRGGSGGGGGLRPQSEYIGGLASGMFGKEHQMPESNTIDNWFQDLQQYESTLDALATASLDQAFTDELNAIEQCKSGLFLSNSSETDLCVSFRSSLTGFRVLSENERTAALYSLLQHATTSQIRFFQKVLSQMSQSDPMSALLSPAVGSSMQREMEARLANANASVAAAAFASNSAASAAAANLAAVTGMKSPMAQFSSQFGNNTPTTSFPASPGFLGAENPIPADGSTGFGSPSAQLAAQRNRNRQQNRISAPGNLYHLAGGLAGDGTDRGTPNVGGYLASGHLEDLIERGSSPIGGESNASRSPNLGAIGSDPAGGGGSGGGLRPKSADFATLAAAAAAAAMTQEQGKSPFARSSSPGPRYGSSALGGTLAAAQDTMQAQAQQAMIGLGLPAATTQAFSSHLAVSASPSFADQFSPLLHTNWASIGNTPLLPLFNGGDPIGGGGGGGGNHSMSTADPAQLAAQLAAMSASGSPAFHSSHGGRVILDDPTKFRRTPSGGRPPGAQSSPHLGSGSTDPRDKPVYAASHNWRSPMLGSGPEMQSQGGGLSGLGIAGGGVGLGMGMGMGMGNFGGPMDSYNSGGPGGLGVGLPSSMSGGSGGQGLNRAGSSRQSSRNNNVRKSPMIGGFPSQPQPQPQQSSSSGPGANGGAGSGAGVSGSDDVDERILKDTANWLRVLRLHKYTPNFADDRWQDMVLMDSDMLEGRGVAALGARKKLLRAFANVREHYSIPHPDWYVPEAVATTGPVNAGTGKDGSGQ
ncbi:hypothetical protein QFC21_003359 [Naganishia friedmannii]|uniref:Uncharacterized protein n=1 Tax=Naganishia friedmannii TaxID=89922 RepID=A0ACC2VR77_9TREE|nr:hypothetical protein QFC21_003359 [Naganishia friedmannii]